MKKMLLIEHLAIVFVLITIAYIIVLLTALAAQLLDVDHTCGNCTISERADLLLNCGKASNLDNFSGKCYTLHRGVFHNVNLLYLEAAITLVMVGLVIGHCIHLMADGYDIVGLVWIRNIIMRFI
jgi:hypothetical protein